MATLRKAPAKWRPFYLVTIYRMRRAGMGDKEVAAELGLKSRTTIYNWRKALPEVRRAEDLAAKELAEEAGTLSNWVYDRLPDDLRELWEELTLLDKDKSTAAAIEALLLDKGKGVRQRLFLHALCENNFSATVALTKVNCTKGDLDGWCAEDDNFAALVREITWHKQNFFDSALVKLVKEGNPQAVIFANKTQNAARGYGNLGKVQVEHTGNITHTGALDLQDLSPYLSESARGEILEALRKYRAAKLRGPESAQDLLYREVAGEGLESATKVSGVGVT